MLKQKMKMKQNISGENYRKNEHKTDQNDKII